MFDWEVQDIVALLGRLELVQLNIDEERKVWVASPNGIFSVRSGAFFFGRYLDHLRKKGLILTNHCCLCKEDEESVSHTLLHCPFTWEVWFGLFRDFGVRWVILADMLSLLLS